MVSLGSVDQALQVAAAEILLVLLQDRLDHRQALLQVAASVEGEAESAAVVDVGHHFRRRVPQRLRGGAQIAPLLLQIRQGETGLRLAGLDPQQLVQCRLGLLAAVRPQQGLDEQRQQPAVVGPAVQGLAEGRRRPLRLTAAEVEAAESDERLQIVGAQAAQLLECLLGARHRLGIAIRHGQLAAGEHREGIGVVGRQAPGLDGLFERRPAAAQLEQEAGVVDPEVRLFGGRGDGGREALGSFLPVAFGGLQLGQHELIGSRVRRNGGRGEGDERHDRSASHGVTLAAARSPLQADGRSL